MSRTQHHHQQCQRQQQSQPQPGAPGTTIADPNSSGRGNDGLLDPVGQPPSDTRSNMLSPSPSPSPGPSATNQSTEYELEDMDSADSRKPGWKGKGKAFAVVQGSTRGEPAPMPPAGSAWQMSWFCDLPDDREPAGNNQPPAAGPVQGAPVRAYPGFSELSEGGAYQRMRKALVVALFAQWGTTGGAIIIAWFTPMRGFGCRSGSYLVYGLVATGSLYFLVLSMVLSHQAMRLYQHQRRGANNATQAPPLTWGHWSVCALANATRFVGKFLAMANAVILLLIAIFEFCGFFDNCWCKSCYPQFKEGGFAVLFRSDSDYQTIAKGAWIGGILLATFVSVILCCVFYWGRKKLR